MLELVFATKIIKSRLITRELYTKYFTIQNQSRKGFIPNPTNCCTINGDKGTAGIYLERRRKEERK